MKTLLLCSSSRFLENDLLPYLGKPLREFKIAYIITAAKGKGGSLNSLQRARKRFNDQNCIFEEIDIAGKNTAQLRSILKNFDAVFVAGGDTFYLLKSARESGFDIVIKELLPSGFVYMGASAGSYLACPTIEMATWKREQNDLQGLTDFSAMNLVPFLITVHYSDLYTGILKEKIPFASAPVKVLSDEQAILVKDSNVQVLGGKEIILL